VLAVLALVAAVVLADEKESKKDNALRWFTSVRAAGHM